MTIPARRLLLSVLTGLFLLQTWLVYTDPAGRAAPALSQRARHGQEIWFEHNCQSCHQLYGFGGFLGPDLTNLSTRLAPAKPVTEEERVKALAKRLESALTLGSTRMPAFHLAADERRALASFFVELDRTGVGQVKIQGVRPPREIFAEWVATLPQSEATDTGRRLALDRGCIDCHLPNARSPFRAPDLTRLAETVDALRLRDVLTDGIPEKGMPRLGLTSDEIDSVQAFLELLGREGEPLRGAFESAERSASGSLLDLPWFEYQR